MQPSLPIVLGVVLLSIHTHGCETNCCEQSTNCCNNSTNCCQKPHCQTSSCCQTTSNCCPQVTNCCNTCQVQCRTSTCIDHCKKDCCTKDADKCKCDVDTPVRITDNGSTNRIIERTGSSNVNNNHHNLSASININNSISNENHISIPINVSNSNVNNIVITSSGNQPSSREWTTPRPWPTEHTTPTTPSGPTTPCPTKVVKIPVLVPVPGETKLIPVPYPVLFPMPQPSIGCCIVMNPCISYECHPYHHSCGGECSHDFLYKPVDPCQGHCHKRRYAIDRHCSWPGYCQNNWRDCSMCGTNFYENYDSYQQCGGCFYR